MKCNHEDKPDVRASHLSAGLETALNKLLAADKAVTDARGLRGIEERQQAMGFVVEEWEMQRSNVKLRGAPLLARPSRTPC